MHDAQGQPLLRGEFIEIDDDDDDVERTARRPIGGDADARGSAEVEFAKATPARQDIECSVRNLEPGTMLTLLIDGQTLGQATVDQRGRVQFEIRISGPASR